MKLDRAVFISFMVSILFIIFTLFMNTEHLYTEQLHELRLSKIQKVCNKKHQRIRKMYVSKRSVHLAQKALDKFLKKNPINFGQNNFSLLLDKESEKDINSKKQTLNKVVRILNSIKEDAVLSITTYTDKTGSGEGNLILSQKRADVLKSYFLQRTNLVLIVAIGYGEALPLTSRRVELNLKNIDL